MDKNNIKHTMMSDMIAYSIYIYIGMMYYISAVLAKETPMQSCLPCTNHGTCSCLARIPSVITCTLVLTLKRWVGATL
jgi:hypothetical protein